MPVPSLQLSVITQGSAKRVRETEGHGVWNTFLYLVTPSPTSLDIEVDPFDYQEIAQLMHAGLIAPWPAGSILWSDEAVALWETWNTTRLQAQVNVDRRLERAFALRLPEHALRLALLFTWDTWIAGQGTPGILEVPALRTALSLIEVHREGVQSLFL